MTKKNAKKFGESRADKAPISTGEQAAKKWVETQVRDAPALQPTQLKRIATILRATLHQAGRG